MPFDHATEVELGAADFDSGPQRLGALVFEAPWGDGPEEMGIDDVGVGPTSFDVRDDGTIVVLDTANGRIVRVSLAAGGTSVSWRLVSTTTLGPTVLAEPTPDGGVLVVQSRFSAEDSEYTVVRLTPEASRSFDVPFEQFAETTAGSDFRLRGDSLYAWRSTKAGAQLRRYVIAAEAFR